MKNDNMYLYESCFFSKEFCQNADRLKHLIHEDYVEYGASGKIYHRQEELEYLLHLKEDRPIKIMDFHQEYIGKDILLVHYRSKEKEKEKEALRTSIWIKTDEGWKIRFHQGTWI